MTAEPKGEEQLHNFKFSIFSYPCEGVSFFRQLQSAIGDGEGGGGDDLFIMHAPTIDGKDRWYGYILV